MSEEQGQRRGIPAAHIPSVLAACAEPALILRYVGDEMTIVGGNQEFVDIAAMEIDDLIRRSPTICLSPSLAGDIETVMAGPTHRNRVDLATHPDHTVGANPVRARLTMFDPEGDHVAHRYVMLTVSPTAVARAHQPHHADVLNVMSDAVLFIDRGHRVQYANTAVETLTGWRPAELVGGPIATLVAGDDQVELTALLARAAPSPASIRLEVQCPGGRSVAVEATATTLTGSEPGVVLTMRDLTSQHEREQALAGLSAVDPLTGLSNRKAFVDHVTDVAAQSHPRELAVAFLDLDNFKTINDALGHDQGDLVLQTIAHRLTNIIGAEGIVARFGGDEFVVATQQPPGQGHDDLVRRLTSAFTDPVALNGKAFQITVSTGIAVTDDADQMAPEAILKAADLAMYEAKRKGKDRVAFYDESLEHRATARIEIESDLRHAIERGDFVLYYQPIMDVITGRPVGSEALVRWIHPDKGMIPPDQFIPIAEATGLIIPLGAWVLETAVAQTAAWNEGRLTRRALGVSVNLSSLQLGDPDLEQHVHATLSRHGFDPARLTLEVTESTLMTDGDGAMAKLERLRDLGVRIAIDDFGTGYSSLAYLKRLPAKALKIDKAFIDGLGTNAEDTSLVTGIIGLASALDLELVAEGVEAELQLRELRRLGCEYSQGYFHSRPLPADDFVAWIGGPAPEPPRGTRLPQVPQAAIVATPPPRTPALASFVGDAEVWELPQRRTASHLFDQDAG